MSEKIIVLHPENQPEVDIYPIIKEGSIPNSVIDNQKIKSRTIINSNIALNTLKYEVLHQTLKDLIDSKITQANMENYLSSYYYNVEETQQYVGSEINTLHQTIQNEFYSNTTIDNMLMEKTDLSLFRQYLPSTYLNLDKQQDNQTSKLNLHANGSIFLTNSGNKTNSGNYYLPNSIVKTEDAPNGYFVLSTTNDDYQSLYNLGAYDKITTNSDGTYTITRQTGYYTFSGTERWSLYENLFWYTPIVGLSEGYPLLCSNGINAVCLNPNQIIVYFNSNPNITSSTDMNSVFSNGVALQYKLATATTEKVEANHYARYNERFILDHNKSEADRSANLLDNNLILFLEESCKNIDYPNFLPVTLKAGTYTLSYSGITKTSGIWLVQLDNEQVFSKDLVNTSITFKCNTQFKFKLYCGANMDGAKFMLNEGSEPLPYQPYEGKTIHEKDLENAKNEINNAKQDKLVNEINIKSINGNSILGSGDLAISGTIPIYGVSQLYQHHYELEAKPSDDTIYVTCWSTKPDKILLKDITRYAFSNIQVYNSGNNETIQVIKWDSTGFNYINNNANIDGMGYIVLHYYINGEPTTY